MSAEGEECPIGMDTDKSGGCTIACAADPTDKDDQTVGCAIARAADPSRSDAEDIQATEGVRAYP
jgi:hypothetical protein